MSTNNQDTGANFRTALRQALRTHAGIDAYLLARGLPRSAISILPLQQLKDAAESLGIDLAGIGTDAAPAAPVAPVAAPAALAAVAAPAMDEDADLDAALASVRSVVLPSILEPLENAISGLSRKAAEAEARAAAMAANPPAMAASVLAFPNAAPVVETAPALPPAKRTGEAVVSSLFGAQSSALKAAKTSTWDAIDAPAVDREYIWDKDALSAAIGPLNRGRNIFLAGPAGTGKTSFAMQYAARTGRPFVRIAFDSYTEPYELVGQYVRGWKDGVLTAAMRRPGTVVLLDEPSRARNIDGVLQTVLDHGFVQLKETGERVAKADGVVFIVADNTFGRGDSTGLYTGTAPMNHAALDRYSAFIKLDYMSPETESRALVNRVPGLHPMAASLVADMANASRKNAANGELTAGLSFRRLTAFCEAVALDNRDAKDAFQDCILNAVAAEDAGTLEELFKAKLDNGKALQAALKGEQAAPVSTATENATMPENRAAQDAFANAPSVTL